MPEFAISFWHRGGRTKTFNRGGTTEAEAIEKAKEAFQEFYGYWPNDPVLVVEA